MTRPQAAQRLSVALWASVTLSLFLWGAIGYSWPFCLLAALPMLAPLHGLLRARRYTFAWAGFFAVAYMVFALTELLANPRARWVAAATLLLVFAWFCSLVNFLRASRASLPAQPMQRPRANG